MSSDILSILHSQAHTFSKGQRLIAKYITEAYDKAAFMTASKLGKKVGVSVPPLNINIVPIVAYAISPTIPRVNLH